MEWLPAFSGRSSATPHTASSPATAINRFLDNISHLDMVLRGVPRGGRQGRRWGAPRAPVEEKGRRGWKEKTVGREVGTSLSEVQEVMGLEWWSGEVVVMVKWW